MLYLREKSLAACFSRTAFRKKIMYVEALSTAGHVITAFFVFIFGCLVLNTLRRYLDVSLKISVLIYSWHLFFCMVYMFYTIDSGGDSVSYYRAALEGIIEFSFGTKFIVFVSYFLINVLNLSYLGLFVFFNILGTSGLLLFYASLKSVTYNCSKKIKKITLMVVLLPSASFWTSALGKDSVSFLATGMALWASLNLQKRKFIMAAAIVVMLLVRPHMAGIMIIALCAGVFLAGKSITIFKKLFIVVIVIPVALVLVPFAANYAGIEDVLNVNGVQEYIEERQGYNMRGGGAIDIANMSAPVRVFSYLFRPLPYEAHSFLSLLSSIDNFVLFGLFIYGVRYVRKENYTSANYGFLWFFVIISVFLLSATTANLGIASRQKWMFMPMLVYLLFSGIAASNKFKKNMKDVS